MTSTRDKLLYAAVSLIRSKGIAGTTVADLLQRSGVARRSLYQHFPAGREELLAEAARIAAGGMTSGLTALLTSIESPREAVGAFIKGIRDDLVASDFTDGCPVAASALAGPDAKGAVADAGVTFAGWIDAITTVITGQGIPAARARSLAQIIVAAVEGATIVSIATRDAEPLDAVIAELNALIDSALTDSGL